MSHEVKAAAPRLTSAKQSGPLVAVLAHQSAISTVESAVANLDALIAAKREAIAQAAAAVPKIDHLTRAREDLLASVAIGQATASEVRNFDEKSEAEKKKHLAAQAKAQQVSEEERQAITGLQRKLSEANEQLRDLHCEDRNVLRVLLEHEAELAGAAYVEAALAVKRHYLRLTALDGLLKNHSSNRAGIVGANVAINLPTFNLAAFDGQSNRNYPETMFTDFLAYTGGLVDEARYALLEEVQAAGVTMI